MADQRVESADESLPSVLARGARSRSDGALAMAALSGFALAAAAAIVGFPAWMAISGAGCALSGFGLWGICDRELAERGGSPAGGRVVRGLWLARIAIALAGGAGALLAAFALLRVALGTWIS